jgi:Zn-dependent protease
MYFIENLFTHPVFFFRVVIIIIASVCLHELAHGVAALSQGDDTPEKSGHMTLNPVVHMGVPSLVLLCIAGIAWGQMPVNPNKFRSPKWSNILVSAAGPLMNLVLALTFIGLMRLTLDVNFLSFLSLDFLYLVAQFNLILCVFNLLPIPPLDGFHVASEFFPRLKPFQNSPFGLFAMMLLFMTPNFGRGLAEVADLVIQALVG